MFQKNLKNNFFILLLILNFIGFGQENKLMKYPKKSFYDAIEMGSYSVGFYDTIIFNEKAQYTQFNYEGFAPLFLQIWHPIEKNKKSTTLSYGELSNRKLAGSIKTVYDTLCVLRDESFIAYNIMESIIDYSEIEYKNHSYFDVLDTLKNYKTKSSYSILQSNSNFPVIVYHHGSQGLSDENFIMAEYFASRGYIFISANYHLPYSGSIYGTSHSFTIESKTEFPKTVCRFAKKISNNDNLFYIGHSWGAQVGLLFLHEKGWVNGFVSMETTLESKNDSLEIKDKWPELYETIQIKEKKFDIPMLLFGRNGVDKPFPFLEKIRNEKSIYASTKKDFGHESYNSAYLLRYLYRHQFKQPDEKIMKQQIYLYHEHLKLIHSFFESIQHKNEFNKALFEKHFYLK